MPSKRCLVKSCKNPAKRIFKIPNAKVVGHNVWTHWMNVVDPDRRNIGGPYGICSSHFSGNDLFFITLDISYNLRGHPHMTPPLFWRFFWS